MDLFRTLLTPTPQDALLLDIGANEGGYTWTMRQYRPGATIFALEPLAEFAQVLYYRYKDDPLVHVWPWGVSDHNEIVEGLHVHEAWTLDTPAHAVRGRNAIHGAHTRSVKFITIDTFLREHAGVGTRPVSFIKIDTDGYEARVLRGARQTLLRDRPTILLELSYMVADLGDSVGDFLDDIYTTLGYVLVDQGGEVRDREYWSSHENYPWVGSFDVAMIPAERLGKDVPLLD